MRAMIEAGAAGVHFEDQLAAEKKCGHLGGKVLVPTSQFVKTLAAARLASDVLDVPTVLVARTDALSATLLTSDVDERDSPFVTGERTSEGFFRIVDGLDAAIARGLAYAPHADVIWFETSTPDLEQAQAFAAAIHERHPRKLLAYNCSPSFNWRRHLSDPEIAAFQQQLGSWGYRFQFITLAGFHSLNAGMFELARGYRDRGMTAYVELQEREFGLEADGYTATRHQREVGAGYFDHVMQAVSEGRARPSRSRARPRKRNSRRGVRRVAGGARVRRAPPSRARIRSVNGCCASARSGRAAFRVSCAAPEDFTVAPAPADLQDRRVEITGPVDRKMMINALNSGARVFMADFEDANSPTWRNVVDGQQNVYDAVRRTIELETPDKHYRLNDETATLVIRNRAAGISSSVTTSSTASR